LVEGEVQHRPFIGELDGSVSSKTNLRRDVALFAVPLLHYDHYHSSILAERSRWLSLRESVGLREGDSPGYKGGQFLDVPRLGLVFVQNYAR